MGKESKMDNEAASRIQSHSDKTGENQDFKARAQSSASKNDQNKIKDGQEKQYTRCPDCGSEKAYYIPVEDGDGGYGIALECPDCHGNGIDMYDDDD
ncbi:MAG: hypothetical protein O8C66_16060 [Candidatus Methanoperedens sp.]|nr:hypothetical protein [Candidatus Methanoperedens sp.]MCZ7372010.1 hypothetical protein [Candidatus Methanoperedens sp.]